LISGVNFNFKSIVKVSAAFQKILANSIIEASSDSDKFAIILNNTLQLHFIFYPQELCVFTEKHSESFAAIKVSIELEDPVEVTQLLCKFFYILG
jgi:hypothetical protein